MGVSKKLKIRPVKMKSATQKQVAVLKQNVDQVFIKKKARTKLAYNLH